MAREIHDELGQQLTALKMDISWVMKKISETNIVPAEKFSSIISLTDNTIKTVRKISSSLRPSVLDDLGLVAALEWQSNEFESRSGIKCSFSLDTEPHECDRNVALTIFRVYQEALTNITRHAHATKVEAHLSCDDQHVKMTVADNGEGFDVEKVKAKKTFGLIGMKERAEITGGSLNIESKPGSGTIITMILPLLPDSQTSPS